MKRNYISKQDLLNAIEDSKKQDKPTYNFALICLNIAEKLSYSFRSKYRYSKRQDFFLEDYKSYAVEKMLSSYKSFDISKCQNPMSYVYQSGKNAWMMQHKIINKKEDDVYVKFIDSSNLYAL